MKSRRSGLVGLVTGAISAAPVSGEPMGVPDLLIVQAIQQRLAGSGLTLPIADTGGEAERIPALLATLRRHRVEGVLLVAPHRQPAHLPEPRGAVPTVLVDCFDAHGTPAVLPDDEAGQHAITARVLAEGHARVGFLPISPARTASPLRMRGYRRALAGAGVPYDDALVIPVDLPGSAGEHQVIYDALERLFALSDPPTAILCGNDRLAVAVFGLLRERGLSIPDDVSVAGCDDHRIIAETLWPALATVELPYAAMGVRAADLLLGLIAGTGAPPAEPIHVRGAVRMRPSLAPLAEPDVVSFQGRKSE